MCKHFNRITVLVVLLIGNAGFALAQKYSITGKLTGFKSGTGVELIDADTEKKIGKTTIQNGTFTLTGTMKNGPRYLGLALTEAGKGYYCKVFAGAGKITITGNKKDFPYDVKIDGPPEQIRYNAYWVQLKNYHIKLDSFMQAYKKAKPNSAEQKAAIIANNKVADDMQVVEKKLLLANSNTYYAANGLYDYLPEISLPLLKTTYASFSPQIKQSVYGKRILAYLNQGEPLKVNDHMFDFEAEDQHGKKQKLSNYSGQYILLDISSIHCGPCIKSNDEMRMLSKKYKGKLHVITFSADSHKDWMLGIKEASVSWISLWDGQGIRESVVQNKYDVRGYPTFVIITPNGIVAERWSGYEKLKTQQGQLEQHLVKYLKKT